MEQYLVYELLTRHVDNLMPWGAEWLRDLLYVSSITTLTRRIHGRRMAMWRAAESLLKFSFAFILKFYQMLFHIYPVEYLQ